MPGPSPPEDNRQHPACENQCFDSRQWSASAFNAVDTMRPSMAAATLLPCSGRHVRILRTPLVRIIAIELHLVILEGAGGETPARLNSHLNQRPLSSGVSRKELLAERISSFAISRVGDIGGPGTTGLKHHAGS